MASVPGASSAAASTWRARDNSPWRTLAQAWLRLRLVAASGGGGWRAGARWEGCAARISCVHSPRWKAAARSNNSARPCDPCCAARVSSMRGTSRNSFQARDARAAASLSARLSVPAMRSSVSACTRALRTAARRNGGTSCIVGTG